MNSTIKKSFLLVLLLALGLSYSRWLDLEDAAQFSDAALPTNARVLAEAVIYPPRLHAISQGQVEAARQMEIAKRRQEQIDKVAAFFKRYGAKLQGYESIFVDKAEECGGDYRVLVGIAGSESGLGRINYMLYNPFGYLDGVQYPDQRTALEVLACRVSYQHIAPCGTDLYCLARRYGGPETDLDHFVSKVAWFMSQVE